MLNDVYVAADSGSRTVLLHLDLSSALDTLDRVRRATRFRAQNSIVHTVYLSTHKGH